MTPQDSGPTRRVARVLGVVVALRAAWRALRRRPPPGGGAGSGGGAGGGGPAGGASGPPPGAPTPPPPIPPEPEDDPRGRAVPASPRAERVVAALLLLAALCGFGFTAVYIVRP